MLGKHMGEGFYKPPGKEKMQRFFDLCEKESLENGTHINDFVLVQEESNGHTLDKYWRYAKIGVDFPIVNLCGKEEYEKEEEDER
jgi:hypothetical protein